MPDTNMIDSFEKRRIVITHPRRLDAPGGGTRSCLQMARYLTKLGLEVILLEVSSEPSSPLGLDNIRVIHVPANPLHYLLNSLEVAKAVKEIIQKKRIDAVIGWEHEISLLIKDLKAHGIIYGMIAARPSYESWMNRKTGFQFIKRKIDHWFHKRPLKSADVVFVASNFTQNELVSLLGIDSKRIVNTRRGVDSVFHRVERKFSGRVTKLLFYGSLGRNKGIFDAVNSLGILAANGNLDWTLRVAGFGNEKAFQQAVDKCGIRDRVTFLGCLSPEELVVELASAELAILPSREESFGRAIAEAQASGLAVISYEVGSVPEIVLQDITGRLVPESRIDLLAEAISEAMKNPEETFQMGIAGRQHVTNLFTWEKTAQAILQGLQSVALRTSIDKSLSTKIG